MILPPSRRVVAALALALVGCGAAASSPAAPPALTLAAELEARPSPAAPALSPGAAPVDLAITFHPGLSGELGWFRPTAEIPLDLLGGAGKRWVDGVPGSPTADPELARLERQIFVAELAQGGLSDTSVVLDEGLLCLPEVRELVERDRPSRLLLAFPRGVTPGLVACLRSLPVPRLYLTGCLQRSHRGEDRCDGDAELALLAADESLRARVRGLALSLARGPSMDALARFPELEYLALSRGRDMEPGLGVEALPFASLGKLRYLDVSSWSDGEEVLSPAALRAFSGLHTLRWSAHLAAPLPAPCQLERYRNEALRPEDVSGLGACAALRELSSDGASFESAEPVRAWPALERLHVRHWQVTDLSPLAALGKLRLVSLPACKAVDYGVLGGMPTLRRVDLSQSGLGDLAVFARLPLLEELDVGFTTVSDLSPLRSLTRLTLLDVHETKVVDLSPIAPLHALQKLILSSTGVRRLGPLTGHPSLEWVILYRSQVTDVAPLLTLPKLRRAHIGGLSLPREQVEQLRKKPGFQLDD